MLSAGSDAVCCEIRSARFLQPVRPGDRLTIVWEERTAGEFSFTCSTGNPDAPGSLRHAPHAGAMMRRCCHTGGMGTPSRAWGDPADPTDSLAHTAIRSFSRAMGVVACLRLFLPVLGAGARSVAGLSGPRTGSQALGGRPLAPLPVLRHLSARPRLAAQRARGPVRIHPPWRSSAHSHPRTARRLLSLRRPSRQLRGGASCRPSHGGRQDHLGDVRRQRAQDQHGAQRNQSRTGHRYHWSRQAWIDAGAERSARRRSPRGRSCRPIAGERTTDGVPIPGWFRAFSCWAVPHGSDPRTPHCDDARPVSRRPLLRHHL